MTRYITEAHCNHRSRSLGGSAKSEPALNLSVCLTTRVLPATRLPCNVPAQNVGATAEFGQFRWFRNSHQQTAAELWIQRVVAESWLRTVRLFALP